MPSDYFKEANDILKRYNITKHDTELIWSIIYPQFTHEEFQRRMNEKEYPHHDLTSLGNHIISDAVVSYILAKKKYENDLEKRELAVIIAMFHELYELAWQNANRSKSVFANKHGFTHPIEGIINAASWYPEYFDNQQNAEIIVDGVIHHMWPFPVRAIDEDIEKLELNNSEKWYTLDSNIQNLIINSSMRGYIKPFHLSLTRSSFIEGRIMGQADKIVAFGKDTTSFLDNYRRR